MLDKCIIVLQKYAAPLSMRLNNNKAFVAIKDGMIASTPVTIVGAVGILLSNLPALDKYAPNLNNFLVTFISQLGSVTIGMLTITILIAVAYSYSNQLKINQVYGVIVAFLAFLLVSDFNYTGSGTVLGKAVEELSVSGVIPTQIFSSQGIFTALITTLTSLKLYSYFMNKDLTIKLPDSVPENVVKSFTSLVPMFLVFSIFLIVRYGFSLTSYGYFPVFMYEMFSKPLLSLGDSIWAIGIFILVQQLLWFFGIHGANVVGTVWRPILLTMMAANLEAFNAGEALPYIVSLTFWEVYSGVFNFSIPLLLMFACKSERAKSIGKFSWFPSIFLVHEPFMYGLPVVMNVYLFIPFILVYFLQFVLVYFLAVVGIAPIPVVPVPWTTPIILSGFIATNFNIMGSVIQILLIAFGFIGYLPFVKAMDKEYLKEEEKLAAKESV